MKYFVDGSSASLDSEVKFEINATGMTLEQAQKVNELLSQMVFGEAMAEVQGYVWNAPENLPHPKLGVAQRVVDQMVKNIINGHTIENKEYFNSSVPSKLADIKYVRTVTGAGLKDAKDFVEQTFPERYKPVSSSSSSPCGGKKAEKRQVVQVRVADEMGLETWADTKWAPVNLEFARDLNKRDNTQFRLVTIEEA